MGWFDVAVKIAEKIAPPLAKLGRKIRQRRQLDRAIKEHGGVGPFPLQEHKDETRRKHDAEWGHDASD